MTTKIVIIGPESTGKSTLSKQLAEYFDTAWVPEFAREFLLQHGNEYTYDDLLTIAQGQLQLEDQLESYAKNNLLIVDTNMIVMRVWCEFVFGKCHPFILEQIAKRHYELYLLCNIDLPWVQDDLREYPEIETRQKLYEIYKNIMMEQQVPWVEITGDNDQRLQTGIEAVNQLIRSKHYY